MNHRDRIALDNHITGHHGEDQFKGDITEYLAERLAEIAALPTFPPDDVRNVISLVRARQIASDALAKWDNG